MSQFSWTRDLFLEFGNALDSSSSNSFLSECVLYFTIVSNLCGVKDGTCFGKPSSILDFFGYNWFREQTVEDEVALEADWGRLSLYASMELTISDHRNKSSPKSGLKESTWIQPLFSVLHTVASSKYISLLIILQFVRRRISAIALNLATTLGKARRNGFVSDGFIPEVRSVSGTSLRYEYLKQDRCCQLFSDENSKRSIRALSENVTAEQKEVLTLQKISFFLTNCCTNKSHD